MNWKTVISFAVITTAFALYLYSNRPVKTGVVDIKTVFEQFNLTRELKEEIKNIKMARQMRLDSLAGAVSGNRAEQGKMEEFKRLRAQFEVQDAQLTEDYDKRIHDKLDIYLKDFAREKNLNILHGTEKLGAVLYADTALDYTTEAIRFINSKHASK
jgi:Skp family chaperone for outer membrane proteins